MGDKNNRVAPRIKRRQWKQSAPQIAAQIAAALVWSSLHNSASARSLIWDGSTNPYTSNHWTYGGAATSTQVSDILTITSGTPTWQAPSVGSWLSIGSTSVSGQSIAISSGQLVVSNSNVGGDSGGLLLTNGGSLGVSGSGAVTLSSGLAIGQNAGDTASVILSGGSLSVSTSAGTNPRVYVGDIGNGILTQSGGTLNAVALELGVNSGSTGLYNFSGGSLNVSGGGVAIGGDNGVSGGSGIWNISGNASINIANSIYIFNTPNTAVNVSGGNIQAAQFNITGGTFAQTGGTCNTSDDVVVGFHANDGGVYTISAGALNVTGRILLGTGGAAQMIQTGGTVSVGAYFAIGDNNAGTGSYQLSGSTSKLTVAGDAYIGNYASGGGTLQQNGGAFSVGGNLSIAYGANETGTFNFTGGSVNVNGNAYIGGGNGNAGGSGTWNISGNANVTITNSLYMFNSSNNAVNFSGGNIQAGLINISGGTFAQTGGTANTSGDVYIGFNANDNGVYTISAGSLNVAGRMLLGTGGNGQISQTGGTVSVGAYFALGDNNAGSGSYQLSGATSKLTVAGDAYIGTYSSFEGYMGQYGGSFTVGGALSLAAGANDTGLYELSNCSAYVTGNVYVGGSAAGAGGIGQLTIGSGATLSTPGMLQIYANVGNDIVQLEGGTLSVGSLNTSGNPSRFIWYYGTLNLTNSGISIGSGQVLGSSLTLNPGMALNTSGGATVGSDGTLNLSGGTLIEPSLTVQTGGSITESAGTINTGSLSLASPSQFNWTSGTLNLTNSSLTIGSGGVLGSTLTLNAGQTLGITGPSQNLNVTGTMNLVGGTINTTSLAVTNPSQFNWSTGTLNLTNSSLTVGSGGVLGPSLTLTAGQTLGITGAGQNLNVTGALNLVGGTINTPSLTVSSPNQFNWSSGTLNLTNSSLTVGSGGTLGSALTLNVTQSMGITGAGQSLNITGTLNVSGGGLSVPTINQTAGSFTDNGTFRIAAASGNAAAVNLSGGTFSVASLQFGYGGNLHWTNGTLRVTGSSLTVGGSLSVTGGGFVSSPSSVQTWGSNSYGQLGNGASTSSSTPVAVTNLSTGVTAVAAGSNHSLALQNGGVFAWGDNQYSELGYSTPYTGTNNIPMAVTNLSSGVTAIAAGGYDSLAIKNGSVYQWGIAYQQSPHLGNSGIYTIGTPTLIANLSSGVTSIAAGYLFNLALQNGGAYAWGRGFNGTLGNGRGQNSSTPVSVTNLSTGVTAIAAGYQHSLAVQNGTAYSWGSNYYGELGTGNENFYSMSTPVAVVGLSNGVTAIAAGEYHSLAVQNGGVYAWGENNVGQLGNNTTSDSSAPLHIDPTDLINITSVAASANSSFALSADGSLWVWGGNTYGELGLATSVADYLTPQHLLPPAGYAYTSIDADAGDGGNAGNHAVAILSPIITNGPLASLLTLNSGQTLQITAAGQSLNLTGTLNVNGGSLSVPTINQTAGSLIYAGTLTLAGSGGGAATYNLSGGTLSATALSIASGGVLNLSASSTANGITVRTISPLTFTGTSMPYGQMNLLASASSSTRQLIVTTGLTFAGSTNAWLGKVDLSSNDLDVQGGSLAVLTNQIKQGFNGGSWNSSGGILSTSAAGDSSHLTALGIIQNNQSGAALYTAAHAFDTTTPGAGDILIKYTYYGDTDLNGKVDGSDYSRIDSGYLTHATGWFNGDFNYDGVINGSDYTLIDNAFNTQGAALTSILAQSTTEVASSSAVPEPTCLGAVGVIGMVGMLRRRNNANVERSTSNVQHRSE